MKKPPDNPEFARFTEAMKTIMQVPKSAILKAGEGNQKKSSRSSSSEPK